MRRIDLIFNLIRVPLDFIMLVGAALAAYLVRTSPHMRDIKPVLFELPLGHFFVLSLVITIFFIFIFAFSGLYLIHKTTPVLQEIAKVSIAVSAGMALIITFMFFNREWFDSRFILFASWVLSIVFVSFGRLTLRALRKVALQKRGIGVENLLILGEEKNVSGIKHQVTKNKKLGLNFIDSLLRPDTTALRELHKEHTLHRVLAVDTNLDREELMKVVSFCEENGIQFSYVPDTFGAILADMSFDILEGMPVVSVRPSPLDGWGKVAKRSLDIVGAIVGLVLLSPIFLVVAILIKLDSKGPVLVKLKRISNGKEFELYKFRSMIDNAEKYKEQLYKFNERKDGPLFKMANDPRITRIGKVLRRRRIDELPQLINVLNGDMSLVGPRPHESTEIEQYKDYHKKVLALKSGMTGLAQISGASDLPFDEEVKLDRFYIENWSLKKDIAILLRTVKLFLFDKSGV